MTTQRADRAIAPCKRVVALAQCLCLLAIGVLSAARAAEAAEIVVTNTNDSGPGSLRQAILATNANPGADLIRFAPPLSGQEIVLTSGTLGITDDLVIVSGTNERIGIRRDYTAPAFRVFAISDGVGHSLKQVTLSGLIISSGRHESTPGDGSGGGGGILTLENLTLTDCVLKYNWARNYGGGIATAIFDGPANNVVTLTNTVVSDNVSEGIAGGIFSRGSVTLTDSTVSGNTSFAPGGGIQHDTGRITLTNTTVSGNKTGGNQGYGGGIWVYRGALTLTNSTVSGNYGREAAGGIGLQGGAADVINSTIYDNQAVEGGGGIFTTPADGQDAASHVVLTNSIIAHNTGGDVHNVDGVIELRGINLVEDGSLTGDLVRNVDPRLGPLQDNGGPTFTHEPQPGSPAINGARLDGLAPASDQRGVPRPIGITADLGSVEAGVVLIVDSLEDEDNGNAGPGDLTLREALRIAPDGAVILFDRTLSGHTINLENGELFVNKALVVVAPSGGLTIDARERSRVFRIDDGDDASARQVSFVGLTIRGGRTPGVGGGIATREFLTLTDVTLRNNSAVLGGGLFVAPLPINVLVMQSTISENAATDGGGLVGPVRVYNSTISGNTASGDGGGLNGGPGEIVSSTIAGNAANRGGGLFTNITRADGTVVVLLNTIVANNVSGGDVFTQTPTDLSMSGRNVVEDGSVTGTGVINVDPVLGPLAANGGRTRTHALLSGSPALDTGSPIQYRPLSTDQRGPGFPRNVLGTVDIGAFEAECAAIALAPAQLPYGVFGTPYSQIFAASASEGPYAYAITAGSLPNGLALDAATGTLTGVPSAVGDFDFTVTVTGGNASNCTGRRARTAYRYSVRIHCPPITIGPDFLPFGEVGQSYSHALSVNGYPGPFTFSLNGSRPLPPGVSLSSDGVISGTPEQEGLFLFNVRATTSGVTSCSMVGSSQAFRIFGARPSTGCAAPSFSPAGSFAAGVGPVAAATADFNGDGTLDLAVANGVANTVSILLGEGAGRFGAATAFDVPGPARSVAAGDFNKDGRRDLVVADQYQWTLYLGDGAGRFAVTGDVHEGASITVGDFNADGNLDVASGTYVSVHLGDGEGGFAAPRESGARHGAVSMAVGDFNGDGRLDLATAYQTEDDYSNLDNVYVLLGDGTGGFVTHVRFGLDISARSIVVGDFNGDGRPDLAVATAGGSVWVFAQNDVGRFAGPASVAAGTAPYTLAAGDFNADGSTDLVVVNVGSNDVSVLLNGCQTLPLTLLPTALSNATVGQPYSQTVAASGASGPYTYAVTSGALPPGLSLNAASGTISATPTQPGTFSLTITATDTPSGRRGSGAYSIQVACSTLALNPQTLANGQIGTPYSQTLSAGGGTAPYTFAVSAGALPPGLALSAGGVVTGTPSTAGTFTLTVTATDAHGCTGTRSYTVIVIVNDTTCGITLGPATLAQPYVAMAYLQQLTASPSADYTFSVSAGALPPGLTLISTRYGTGILGVPTIPGTYSFTIKAQKKGSTCAGTRSYTVTVPRTVVPALSCVMKTGSKTYLARFGYDNTTGGPVTVPVGSANYFTPGAQNRGQVTTFQSGRVANAFSVAFTVSGNSSDLAIWFLRGPDNQRRPVNVTTATKCQ